MTIIFDLLVLELLYENAYDTVYQIINRLLYLKVDCWFDFYLCADCVSELCS